MKRAPTSEDLKRGIRIAHLRGLLGLGQEQFAALLEVTRGAVGNWELGQACGLKSIKTMSSRTGAELEWLLDGKGARPESIQDLGRATVPIGFEFPSDAPEPKQRSVSKNRPYEGGAQGAIPDIDTSAGAGPGGYGTIVDSAGAIMLHGDAVRGEIVLPGYLLSEYTRTSANRVHSIVVRGDSMEETLKSGDRVFVDTLDISVGQGGVFVLVDLRTNETLVKRLRRIQKGKQLEIISDNPKQGPPDIVGINEVFIVGRAVGRLSKI